MGEAGPEIFEDMTTIGYAEPGAPLDFGGDIGGYFGRVHGAYDGNPHALGDRSDLPDFYWKQAGNLTQWRGDGART
jgi:hypothetical protein